MAIAKFHSQLKENHQLFKILSGENAPKWWEIVKNHKDIYIDIRKENYINIYYCGASIAKIEMKRGQKQPSAKIHPKYLGHNDQMDSRYYKERYDKKRNKIVYDPIYQDCTYELENNLDRLIQQAYDIYVNRNDKEGKNPENISEKKIQGRIIINSKPLYIDSEFAHRYEEGSKKTIRIDLVRIQDNKIQFVELKRIQDSRMWHNEKDPEIITQIDEYKKFLSENENDILKYYKTLLSIKSNLKLPLPIPKAMIDDIGIDTTPVLLIADNSKQIDRKKRIEDILNKNDVIIEYANNYS